MATQIHDIRHIGSNADLSSFNVQGNQLQKLNFFQNIAQKISDFFSGFSTAGKFEIATRNAKVAMCINALSSQATHDALATGTISDATLYRMRESNAQSFNALVEQIEKAPFDDTQKNALMQHLGKLSNDLEQADNAHVIVQLSKGLRSLEQMLFTPADHANKHNYTDLLEKSLEKSYMTVQDQKDVFEACACGMYNKGRYILPHSINLRQGGIDAEVEDGMFGLNRRGVAEQLKVQYLNSLPLTEKTLTIGIATPGERAVQGEYVKGVIQDVLLTKADTMGPFFATVLNPDTFVNFIADELPAQTGLWNMNELRDVHINAVPQNITVAVRPFTSVLRLEISGDINFVSAGQRGAPSLGTKHFSASVVFDDVNQKMPQGFKHPGTGTDQDGKELFMPNVSVHGVTMTD